jgi:hypothetical protein
MVTRPTLTVLLSTPGVAGHATGLVVAAGDGAAVAAFAVIANTVAALSPIAAKAALRETDILSPYSRLIGARCVYQEHFFFNAVMKRC